MPDRFAFEIWQGPELLKVIVATNLRHALEAMSDCAVRAIEEGPVFIRPRGRAVLEEPYRALGLRDDGCDRV